MYFLSGGSTLYIETALRNTQQEEKPLGSLELTGHLGDVMKESARIALTVARNFLALRHPGNTFLNNRSHSCSKDQRSTNIKANTLLCGVGSQ